MAHSGGKAGVGELGVAEVPLLWMESEAQKAGLRMTSSIIRQGIRREGPTDTLTIKYWLPECFPCLKVYYDIEGKKRRAM